MGTTTKGCNVTPLSTWHFNGNHGHDFNSQITSTGFDRTPISSIGPNNAPGHVLETQERGFVSKTTMTIISPLESSLYDNPQCWQLVVDLSSLDVYLII
ncbi:uncharacterized protein LOC108224776 isoform X2 [Daucus carota subsp. sativus]|uniref:uncharacterized protein LOC108224776 isoform X2 n=1 Tax=Daucus carota subsp. sativus TaxID=79200 RepID=UPI0030832D0F